MIKHYIILASAYSIGARIVLHYTDDKNSITQIKEDQEYISKKCGENLPISMHMIQTNSNDWNSVIKLDRFFEDTKLIATKEEFAEILLKDRELSSLDVAHYILSIIPCTHLKLQKLVYMCYADYLCNEHKKLFDDSIYAYRLGPVVTSVYEKYKKSGKGKLEIEDNKTIYDRNAIKLSSRSRILAARDGIKKLISINQTLDKYSKLTASELVDLTHKDGAPWAMVNSDLKDNIEIDDEAIIMYHNKEVL